MGSTANHADVALLLKYCCIGKLMSKNGQTFAHRSNLELYFIGFQL